MRILENLRYKDNNVLKIANKYLNQYFSGPLCMFKFVKSLREYQSYGLIVEKGNRVSEFTCVAQESCTVLKISGIVYHKIFSELKDKFFFCQPFFQKVMTNTHPLIVKELSLQTQRKIYNIGQPIYMQNEESECMYIVKDGSVAYRVGNTKILQLTAGDYFGLEDLFLGNGQRFLSAFCESQNTVLYAIHHDNFKT